MQLNGGVDSNPFLRIESGIYRIVIAQKITHIARATGCSRQAFDYIRLNARLRFAQHVLSSSLYWKLFVISCRKSPLKKIKVAACIRQEYGAVLFWSLISKQLEWDNASNFIPVRGFCFHPVSLFPLQQRSFNSHIQIKHNRQSFLEVEGILEALISLD